MIVTCDEVSYRYRGRIALDGFSARLGPGVVGLLGPNGAGKSTLMALISTVRGPQTGSIRVGDTDIRESRAVREQLGYLPQRFAVMPRETVRRTVEYAAWARGVERSRCAADAQAALERVGLAGRAGDRVGTLSGGYRQRVGLACALAGDPPLLLLDEPTVGIDPVQRSSFRQLLAELGRSRTVIVSTHLLEDVAMLSSQVVVMSEGRCVFSGAADDLALLGRQHRGGTQSDLEAGYETCLVEASR